MYKLINFLGKTRKINQKIIQVILYFQYVIINIRFNILGRTSQLLKKYCDFGKYYFPEYWENFSFPNVQVKIVILPDCPDN